LTAPDNLANLFHRTIKYKKKPIFQIKLLETLMSLSRLEISFFNIKI